MIKNQYELDEVLSLNTEYVWFVSKDINMPFAGVGVCANGKVYTYYFNKYSPVGTAVYDFNDKYYAKEFNKKYFVYYSSLHKCIPLSVKAVEDKIYDHISYQCPCCGNTGIVHSFTKKYFNYCPNCGQALDWGDSK